MSKLRVSVQIHAFVVDEQGNEFVGERYLNVDDSNHKWEPTDSDLLIKTLETRGALVNVFDHELVQAFKHIQKEALDLAVTDDWLLK